MMEHNVADLSIAKEGFPGASIAPDFDAVIAAQKIDQSVRLLETRGPRVGMFFPVMADEDGEPVEPMDRIIRKFVAALKLSVEDDDAPQEQVKAVVVAVPPEVPCPDPPCIHVDLGHLTLFRKDGLRTGEWHPTHLLDACERVWSLFNFARVDRFSQPPLIARDAMVSWYDEAGWNERMRAFVHLPEYRDELERVYREQRLRQESGPREDPFRGGGYMNTRLSDQSSEIECAAEFQDARMEWLKKHLGPRVHMKVYTDEKASDLTAGRLSEMIASYARGFATHWAPKCGQSAAPPDLVISAEKYHKKVTIKIDVATPPGVTDGDMAQLCHEICGELGIDETMMLYSP